MDCDVLTCTFLSFAKLYNVLTVIYVPGTRAGGAGKRERSLIQLLHTPHISLRFIYSEFRSDYLIDRLKTCPVNNFLGK